MHALDSSHDPLRVSCANGSAGCQKNCKEDRHLLGLLFDYSQLVPTATTGAAMVDKRQLCDENQGLLYGLV